MAVNIRKILQGLGLIPAASSTISAKGEMEVLNSDGRLYLHDGSAIHKVTTNDTTDTLTGKTMDGGSNTFTNLPAGSFSGQVPVASGGTGAASLTAHGVVIGEGTSAVAVTSAGTAGQALVSGGASADPAFGTVAISGGGTGQVTQQAALDALAGAVTSGSVLRGNGTHVTLSAIQASDVPTLNQNTTGTAANVTATTNSTLTTLSSLALPSSQLTGQVAIANGGTGAATKAAGFDALSPMTTSGDVIYGGASGTGTRLAKGSDGNVLTLASGVPSWAAPAAASPLTTKGDLYGYSTTNARLPVGSDGQTLVADSSQTLGVKWGAGNGARTINAQSGTTYTFVLSDGSNAGGNPLVTATNSAAQTYTVPPNSSVAYPVGAQIDITQLGAGLVTLAAGAGVTLNSSGNGLTMLGQYSAATLVKTATDTWEVYGTGTTVGMPLTDWQSFTVSIGGSTSAPTKGTISLDQAFYRRVGDSIEINWNYIQTAAGSAGSGTYLFSLPSGLTFDATKITVTGSTSTNANARIGSATVATGSGGTGGRVGHISAYNTTQFTVSLDEGADVLTSWGSSNAPLSNTTVQASLAILAPISGWTSGASYSSTALSLTDWNSNLTFTPNNFGTVTNAAYYYRRVGDSMEVVAKWTSGTPAGASGSLSLPSGYAIDSSKMGTAASWQIGLGYNATGGASQLYPGNAVVAFYDGSDTAKIYFANSGTGSTDVYTKTNASTFVNAGVGFSVRFIIPISGWTSTGAGTLTAPRTQAWLASLNGFGSTNTAIARFSFINSNTGSLTITQSATAGDSITIQEAGIYSVSMNASLTNTAVIGISINSNQLTTSLPSITTTNRLCATQITGADVTSACGATVFMNVGDVLRVHAASSGNSNGANSADGTFIVTKVSN